jgi:hypothetical protein
MASMMMGYLQEVADRAKAERTRKGQNSWHMQMDRWLEGFMRFGTCRWIAGWRAP